MTRPSRIERCPSGSRPRPPRARALAAAGLAAAAIAALLGGCDNPACVFGGDCSGSSGSGALGGGNPAFRPAAHAWLREGAPAVVRAVPSGAGQHPDTPIAVLFDESMAAQTVVSAVGLFEAGGPVPTPVLPPALVGDGRVLVVVPLDTGAGALKAGSSYELRWDEDAMPTDLTGAALPLPANRVITSFTVASTNPVAPRVLLTFPEDGRQDQSATGELVVVFDREVQSATVNAQSFVVTVNGQPPAFGSPPQPVLLLGQGAFPTTDRRVWQYRHVNGAGEPVSLGNAAAVRLRMSPTGAKIVADDGGQLPDTTIDYDTAAFAAPTAGPLSSVPDDAIGIENLSPGGAEPLALTVTLSGALASDMIGVFLFGGVIGANRDQALFREVRFSDVTTGPDTAVLTEAELDLASSGTNLRFAEGALTIALRTERGGVISPVALVDVDPDRSGDQDPLMDVTRPVFLGFGSSGSQTSSFVSDQRDLTVVGRANEELRAVFVDATPLGDNGTPFGGTSTPVVVGSSDDGFFVAAPVQVGALDPALQPAPFSMRLYDRALNAGASAVSASFEQRGGSLGAPGGALDLRVFDARTLVPVQGAAVYLHSDTGGVPALVTVATTDASGRPVPGLAFPAGEALVTVAASGYDLVSFHGVASGVLGLPLRRTSNLPGSVLGKAASTSSEFPTYDRYVGDVATLALNRAYGTVSGCSFNVNTLSYECDYGPLAVRPGALRALSLVAVDVPASAVTFTAQGFLRAHLLELPLAPVSPGSQSLDDLRVEQLLSDSATPQEERAVDGPGLVLDASGLAGVDLSDLDGEPGVAVQALAPGLGGSLLVGFGAALDPLGSPADTWTVASAVAGVADPTTGKYPGDELGRLVLERTIDPDLFLRAELRDQAGNRAGRRPRFSSLGGTLAPPEVPLVTSPPPGGGTGAEGFAVVFDHVLAGQAASGLYRVTLTAPNGRSWVLYRRATGGGTVKVPDLVAAGGSGLPDGTLACVVEAYAWPGYDPQDFLVSDVAREHDRFSQGAPVSFAKP